MTDSFYGCLLNRQRTTLASSSIVYGGTLSLLLAGTYSIMQTVTLTQTEIVVAFYYLIINLTSKPESRQNFSTVFKQKILPAYPTFLVLFVGVVWLLQVDLIQRCFKYLQGLTGLSGCFMLISIYLELQYNNSTVVQLDCKKKMSWLAASSLLFMSSSSSCMEVEACRSLWGLKWLLPSQALCRCAVLRSLEANLCFKPQVGGGCTRASANIIILNFSSHRPALVFMSRLVVTESLNPVTVTCTNCCIANWANLTDKNASLLTRDRYK